jgi:hypothetical protein
MRTWVSTSTGTTSTRYWYQYVPRVVIDGSEAEGQGGESSEALG